VTSTITRPFEQARLRVEKVSPKANRALGAFDAAIELDGRLRDLISLRASIINGCAYCIDLHTKDARKAGESEQRLYAVAAWHEAPFFDERERAALALTDAVTLVSDEHVSRAIWDEAAAHFDKAELAQLLWAIIAINAWNRLAIATRMEPGTYEP
jgi:AhpD family alkylhydroperoxidase